MDECASCGIPQGGDDTKLKTCACKLVRYCSVDCQRSHRSKHKKACKQQMAKLRDDLLMEQPDSTHLGDCEICCLPLPLDGQKYSINTCCCKRICDGCNHANYEREREESLEHRCPFCRQPTPETDEETDQNEMKRAKANDPVALYQMGGRCADKGDYDGAFEYWTKAARLGDMEAHYNLSRFYYEGRGVDRNEKKQVYHLEEAAIGGHPEARYSLGVHEGKNGKHERAIKHSIIAAKLGYDDALEYVRMGCQMGIVSKEDYEAALRGHQAFRDATKSTQREAADAFWAAQRVRNEFLEMMRGVPHINITM
jgi:tetratricopeptide (TPR) repeat protein